MLIAGLHASAPAPIPQGSVAGWLLLAIVLAAMLAAGVLLSARR